MRTDRFFLAATALFGALLGLHGPALVAQDTLEATADERVRVVEVTRCGTCGNRLHNGRCIRCEVAA